MTHIPCLLENVPHLQSKSKTRILEFFTDNSKCIIAKGPPGTLKSMTIEWAAKRAGVWLDRLEIDGAWSPERMRTETNRTLGQSLPLIDNGVSQPSRRGILILGLDMEMIPAMSIEELFRTINTQTGNKFIIEVNDVSAQRYMLLKQHAPLVFFNAINDESMRRIFDVFQRHLPAQITRVDAAEIIKSSKGDVRI